MQRSRDPNPRSLQCLAFGEDSTAAERLWASDCRKDEIEGRSQPGQGKGFGLCSKPSRKPYKGLRAPWLLTTLSLHLSNERKPGSHWSGHWLLSGWFQFGCEAEECELCISQYCLFMYYLLCPFYPHNISGSVPFFPMKAFIMVCVWVSAESLTQSRS